MDVIELKRQAAEKAVEWVQSGMVVGLGTGSTAVWAVRHLGALLQTGALTDIVGIPTSQRTAEEAQRVGIPLTTLDDHPQIDITIDGADEVSPILDLIKGGGGALLREKIVAQASKRLFIIVDESKLSAHLGTKWPVPVEVVPFGWTSQLAYLQSLGATVTLRRNDDDTPYITDNHNLILDCDFGQIQDPAALAAILNQRTGIVEHGLFIQMTTDLIMASLSAIEHRQR